MTGEEEKALIAAVERAGRELLDLWPGRGVPARRLKLRNKADGSPVTNADELSNQIIEKALRQLFPHDLILSEESPPPAQIKGRTWIIDPLDGTWPYIRGRDSFSVFVALAIDYLPIFAVISQPARGILGTAEEGRGVRIGSEPATVSTNDVFSVDRIFTRHCRLTREAHMQKDFCTALLELCSGELDGAVIRIRRHQAWDLAAAVAFVRAAGGTATDEYGRCLRFENAHLSFKYAVFSNGRIHQQLLAVLAEAAKDPWHREG